MKILEDKYINLVYDVHMGEGDELELSQAGNYLNI